MQTQQLLAHYKEQRQQHRLWRQRQCVAPQTAALNFSSNDYLALSRHPKVVEAFQAGLAQWGTGSGGSPLTTGYQAPHRALEEALCDWLGFESALLFSSGFAANQGCLQALSQLGMQVVLDKLSHASLYAGARQGPHHTGLVRFRHNDIGHLSQVLGSLDTASPRLIVSEGLFSMDGDSAPIDELMKVKQSEQAGGRDTLLMLDDAHGLGARGAQGRGSFNAQQRQQIDIYTATFGKALGCQGAFVAGSRDMIDYLVQRSGEYIYSTAMPAAQACAVLAAIRLVRDEKLALQQALEERVVCFRQQAEAHGIRLETPPQGPCSAIQPLLVGSADHALYISSALQHAGITAVAIRQPTVPKNKARLRFTVSLHQTQASIEHLMKTLTLPLGQLQGAIA